MRILHLYQEVFEPLLEYVSGTMHGNNPVVSNLPDIVVESVLVDIPLPLKISLMSNLAHSLLDKLRESVFASVPSPVLSDSQEGVSINEPEWYLDPILGVLGAIKIRDRLLRDMLGKMGQRSTKRPV